MLQTGSQTIHYQLPKKKDTTKRKPTIHAYPLFFHCDPISDNEFTIFRAQNEVYGVCQDYQAGRGRQELGHTTRQTSN